MAMRPRINTLQLGKEKEYLFLSTTPQKFTILVASDGEDLTRTITSIGTCLCGPGSENGEERGMNWCDLPQRPR